jgi:UDP-N-acetyl-D-glucosamine dehydrogenase
MPEYVVQRLTLALNQRKIAVNGSSLLLLGLTYKPNTSDIRESPALVVAQNLARFGAQVRYVDAHVVDEEIANIAGTLGQVALTKEVLETSDAVVVLTDHDDIDYDFVAQHAHYVLDTRHRCRGPAVSYL